jgi:hypothetical protein
MQPHTKIYLEYFGYGPEDFIPCELCGDRSGPPHHIDCRGMGGSKGKDVIENLMGLCPPDHVKYGDKKQFMEFLKEKHKIFMERFGK